MRWLRTHWVVVLLVICLIAIPVGGAGGYVLYDRQLDKAARADARYEEEHEKYLAASARAQRYKTDYERAVSKTVELAAELEDAESQREAAKTAANAIFGEPGWYIVQVSPYGTEGLLAVEKHDMETCQSYFERDDSLWSSSEPAC